MSQYTDAQRKGFTAGGAIAANLRVKLSSGVLAVAVAGVTDQVLEIGTMESASFANGDRASVVLRNKSGSVKMVASAAIAAGVAVFGAVGGKIATSSSGASLGVSLEAAAADNDVIEVLRHG